MYVLNDYNEIVESISWYLLHRYAARSARLENNQTAQVDPSLRPDTENAVEEFGTGEHLIVLSSFGDDALQRNQNLVVQRET